MRVGEARGIARAWVREHAAGDSGYRGAVVTGSTAGLDVDADLPPWSDVDVVVVVDARAPAKVGKVAYRGVLVDVSSLPARELEDVAVVARTHFLAPSFRGGQLLDDPSGLLKRLEDAVAPAFATLPAVLDRSDDALAQADRRLQPADPDLPFEQQVLAWLFPAGLPAVALAVAALQPPTVRLRYLVARQVLRAAGDGELYERLLAVLGSRDVTATTVRRHLDALARVFDAAAAVRRTPLPFSGDITVAARRVSIDGSRALVDAGDHREATFWIAATWARCQQVLVADGSAEAARSSDAGFRVAVGDLLDIDGPQQLARRIPSARGTIPLVRAAARRLAERAVAEQVQADDE